MSTSPEIIYYHQNILGDSEPLTYVSLEPIKSTVRNDGSLVITQLHIAAFNIGAGLPSTPNTPYIHLNDIPATDEMYKPLWSDVKDLQSKGVKVLMLLGGAGAEVSGKDNYGYHYNNNTWNLILNGNDSFPAKVFYELLLATLVSYKLDGISLDFEAGSEAFSATDVINLIAQLRQDYQKALGKELYVALTPVASSLSSNYRLTPFADSDVYALSADAVDNYSGQFYNGFGTVTEVSSTDDYAPGYENTMNKSWTSNGETFTFPANKVVLGAELTAGEISTSAGYQDYMNTISGLLSKYPDFAGVFAWLYTDSVPVTYPDRPGQDPWLLSVAQALGID